MDSLKRTTKEYPLHLLSIASGFDKILMKLDETSWLALTMRCFVSTERVASPVSKGRADRAYRRLQCTLEQLFFTGLKSDLLETIAKEIPSVIPVNQNYIPKSLIIGNLVGTKDAASEKAFSWASDNEMVLECKEGQTKSRTFSTIQQRKKSSSWRHRVTVSTSPNQYNLSSVGKTAITSPK